MKSFDKSFIFVKPLYRKVKHKSVGKINDQSITFDIDSKVKLNGHDVALNEDENCVKYINLPNTYTAVERNLFEDYDFKVAPNGKNIYINKEKNIIMKPNDINPLDKVSHSKGNKLYNKNGKGNSLKENLVSENINE